MSPRPDWKVDPKEGFETGGNYMQASCHHRTGRASLSACGGCYARLTEALRLIGETGDTSIASEVSAAMQAEGRHTAIAKATGGGA